MTMEEVTQGNARKRNLIRMIIDLVIAAIIGGSLLVIKFAAIPFERGFFCDDESLKHPYKDSTIPTATMAAFSIVIPLVFILIIEAARYYQTDNKSRTAVGPCNVNAYIYVCYYTVGLFLCGMGVTQQFTDLTKNMVGRLRPHFMAVCNPNFAALNCSSYIEGNVCDPNANHEQMIDARRSFMSGHSSVSMYAAVYLAIYLQARMNISRYAYTVRPVVQAWSLLLALYCSLTRISDYKHHWSDVLTGCLTGSLIAVVTAYFISDLFKGPTMHTISRKLTELELQKKTDKQKTYGTHDVSFDINSVS